MKNSAILALLLAAMLLCGCPTAGTDTADESAATAPAAQDTGAADQETSAVESAFTEQPDAEEPAATDSNVSDSADESAEVAAEPQEAPPPDTNADEAGSDSAPTTDQDTGSGVFELAGLRLGMSPQVYRVYYDSRPDIVLVPTWIEQGLTGVITANLSDGSVSYGEVAYFLDGELVGVMRHKEEAVVKYADLTNDLERRFGPPEQEPPRWARVTPFFAAYQKPEEGLVMKFWGNSRTREVFYAARNNSIGTTDYMLCDVDRFDDVSQQIQMGQFSPQG
jgi:hypothetical protein